MKLVAISITCTYQGVDTPAKGSEITETHAIAIDLPHNPLLETKPIEKMIYDVNRRLFTGISRDFLDFINGSILLFYNEPLAAKAIQKSLAAVDDVSIIDVKAMAQERFPEPLCSIDNLCHRFAIPQGEETALAESFEFPLVLIKIYIAMLHYDAKPANNPMRSLRSQKASKQIPFIYNLLESRCAHGNKAPLPSSIASLDQSRGGFHRGELVILAGVETTTAAIKITTPLALRMFRPCTVAAFSLRQSATSWTKMMLAEATQMELKTMRAAQFSQEEWGRIDRSCQQIESADVHIFDLSPGFLKDINYSCRRIRRETTRLDVVVIDDLHLIHGPEANQQDYNAIIHKLKSIAIQTDAVFILLVDLPKCSPQQTLTLNDLQPFSAIEEDADVILFNHPDQGVGRGISVAKVPTQSSTDLPLPKSQSHRAETNFSARPALKDG